MNQEETMNESERQEVQKVSFGDALKGKYMTFKLAEEAYGLGILKVKEIIGYMDITKVPKTENFMRGIINLRGKVIPVIDLRLKFGMEEIEPNEQTVIFVAQLLYKGDEFTMGVIVDEVMEVLDIQSEQIEPPPNFGTTSINTDFILGVGKSDERVIFLLDINKVLTGDEVNLISSSLEAS